jgi:signal transduction histidine kinase
MSRDGGEVERVEEGRERADGPARVDRPEGEETGRDHGLTEDVPGWWDPAEGTAPDVAEAARRLAALTNRPVEADLPHRLEPLARSYDSDVLSRAVTEVHACLDAAAGGAVPRDEAGEIRRRLNRITEAVWTRDVRYEREICRDVLREVSHDIRSPLNSILFLADGLYSGRSGSLTDAQRRQLGVVYSAAATLLNMVNDLLDYARTSDGEIGEAARVPFSVSGVLADVRRLVGPIAEHRDCRLRTEMEVQDPRVGDPQIVSRVLVNLVSNAIDAAGKDGEVAVRVTGDEERLRLKVLDDGEEVDPERLEDLAAPEADDSFTRTLSGQTHGLGLVICGRMVRAAGGSLEADRTSEGWTEFTVELPFGRS